MNIVGFFKLLWDLKLFQTVPGYLAIVLIGYVYGFELQPLAAEVKSVKGAVDAIRLSQIEERLDSHYAALCMENGDPVLLELIRKLETEYRNISPEPYQRKSCDLLLKLK
jgi:hypothetical protein